MQLEKLRLGENPLLTKESANKLTYSKILFRRQKKV
jgi:hypothetical protein